MMAFRSPTEIYFATRQGRIHQFDGVTLKKEATPTDTASITALLATDTEVFAGQNGLAWRRVATGWEPIRGITARDNEPFTALARISTGVYASQSTPGNITGGGWAGFGASSLVPPSWKSKVSPRIWKPSPSPGPVPSSVSPSRISWSRGMLPLNRRGWSASIHHQLAGLGLYGGLDPEPVGADVPPNDRGAPRPRTPAFRQRLDVDQRDPPGSRRILAALPGPLQPWHRTWAGPDPSDLSTGIPPGTLAVRRPAACSLGGRNCRGHAERLGCHAFQRDHPRTGSRHRLVPSGRAVDIGRTGADLGTYLGPAHSTQLEVRGGGDVGRRSGSRSEHRLGNDGRCGFDAGRPAKRDAGDHSGARLRRGPRPRH